MSEINGVDWVNYLFFMDGSMALGDKPPPPIIVAAHAISFIDSVVIVLSNKTTVIRDIEWFERPRMLDFSLLEIVDQGKTLSIDGEDFSVEDLLDGYQTF